jgi:DNA-directed RNA polymerase subunit RPC12/RpoP
MERIEDPNYVKIPCRSCGIRALVIEGRPWPKRCIRCGAAFQVESRTFENRAEPRVAVST